MKAYKVILPVLIVIVDDEIEEKGIGEEFAQQVTHLYIHNTEHLEDLALKKLTDEEQKDLESKIHDPDNDGMYEFKEESEGNNVNLIDNSLFWAWFQEGKKEEIIREILKNKK